MDNGTSKQPIGVLCGSLDRPFRILQLTDFHNDADDSLTEKTYADVRAIIGHVAPDFLAVTGDIWCGDDKSDRAPTFMRRDLDFLGSLGVPWAFTWGNHDYVGDFNESMHGIATTPNAVAPRGDGQGNFRIELRSERFDSACWDIFFLNSRSECLIAEDVDWLECEALRVKQERCREVPAIAYFHIPLQEYEEARTGNCVVGFAGEEVLFWGNDESRFEAIRRAGNVRACFVGHSHANDYWFRKDGIVLAYGRATGHGGYGADRLAKGAKLLELDLNSDRFTFRTVFPDGSTWTGEGNYFG